MCERCTRHTECTKRLSIQRFPQVIVIRILGNDACLRVHRVCLRRAFMTILNNLLQTWIVLRCHGGQLVKAPFTFPSRSLTWTLDHTDLSTMVTNLTYYFKLYRLYLAICDALVHYTHHIHWFVGVDHLSSETTGTQNHHVFIIIKTARVIRYGNIPGNFHLHFSYYLTYCTM